MQVKVFGIIAGGATPVSYPIGPMRKYVHQQIL